MQQGQSNTRSNAITSQGPQREKNSSKFYNIFNFTIKSYCCNAWNWMQFNERDVNAPKETLKRCGRCIEWKEWWFTYDKCIFIFISNQYPWISDFVLAKLNKMPLSFSSYSTFHINAMICPLDDIWVKKVQMLDSW